jgi:hypothetical protein
MLWSEQNCDFNTPKERTAKVKRNWRKLEKLRRKERK